MEALREWYASREDRYEVAGPIPLPLDDWDYRFVEENYVSKRTDKWPAFADSYIYALALDGSPHATTTLDEMANKVRELDEHNGYRQAVMQVEQARPFKSLGRPHNFADAVLKNAFFIGAEEKKVTTARLLGLNQTKDKALVELHVNWGPLAEKWWHVVIAKSDEGWRWFSITLVAIS